MKICLLTGFYRTNEYTKRYTNISKCYDKVVKIRKGER